MTILTGSRLSDSSLTSVIPSIFFSKASSDILFTNMALLTSNGISEIIIWSFPFSFTKVDLLLTITLPRPFVKASIIPCFPSTIPPVGKSGPLTISKIVSRRQLGLSILLMVASMISPKLWGGIFVAYPADIPVEPLTRRLGNLAGRTVGSSIVSSKLGAHVTVFLFISFNSSIDILARRAYV